MEAYMIRIGMATKATFTILALLIIGANSAITQRPSRGDCLCAIGNVNGRSTGSLSGRVLKVLRPSSKDCGTFLGGVTSNNGYTWYGLALESESQTVWVVGHYLKKSANSMCGSTGNQCPTIISRSQWGAREPKSVSNLKKQPVQYAFIHHSTGKSCTSQTSCSRRVKSFQDYHMNRRGKTCQIINVKKSAVATPNRNWDKPKEEDCWSDVGYSFLIGGDGKVYEGRGWDRAGAHTSGYNSVGLGFCFIGDFQTRSPSQRQINAAKQLLACGKSMGKLKSNYVLKGHRDVGRTTCPGDRLYTLIRTWPHYTP